MYILGIFLFICFSSNPQFNFYQLIKDLHLVFGEKERERLAVLCYATTVLCGNSWNWRTGPKDSVVHRKAKEVKWQKVWKLRYVVTRASVTVTGKVWQQRGRFWFGRKQMTLWSVWCWRDTAGFHQDCVFLWMATKSCLQTQTEPEKTHVTLNLPEQRRVLTSSKKRTSAWSDHPLLIANHLELQIPLDLPGCSGSPFVTELPTLELRPSSILRVSKLFNFSQMFHLKVMHNTWLALQLRQTMTARKTAYFSHSWQNRVGSWTHSLLFTLSNYFIFGADLRRFPWFMPAAVLPLRATCFLRETNNFTFGAFYSWSISWVLPLLTLWVFLLAACMKGHKHPPVMQGTGLSSVSQKPDFL